MSLGFLASKKEFTTSFTTTFSTSSTFNTTFNTSRTTTFNTSRNTTFNTTYNITVNESRSAASGNNEWRRLRYWADVKWDGVVVGSMIGRNLTSYNTGGYTYYRGNLFATGANANQLSIYNISRSGPQSVTNSTSRTTTFSTSRTTTFSTSRSTTTTFNTSKTTDRTTSFYE